MRWSAGSWTKPPVGLGFDRAGVNLSRIGRNHVGPAVPVVIEQHAMSSTATRDVVFQPFREADRQELAMQIRQQVPYYVRMQLSPLEGRVASVLQGLVNRGRKPAVDYFAFFCSSTQEAISGAVKLARHNLFARDPAARHATLVYDPGGNLQSLFDPLCRGAEEALVPGFFYEADWDAFRQQVESRRPDAILVRQPASVPQTDLDQALASAASREIITILDESTTNLHGATVAAALTSPPDIILFGENLSDYKSPAGCFLMRDHLFRVWNDGKNYNLHSNTWGGNSTSLSAALRHLRQSEGFAELPREVRDQVIDQAQPHQVTTQLYAQRCNPKLAQMCNLGGLNKDIRQADRTSLFTQTRRGRIEVLDGSGTYGVNLHGHNRREVLDAVLASHDETHDYWRDLEAAFEERTGLNRLLPAVSGTTATEAALAMGLLSQAPRKKVIVMQGGFGGKSLPALISTSRERFKEPFRPLYPHVVAVDPFDPAGIDHLRREIVGGDVAMVLLETVQGEGGVRELPAAFFAALAELRRQHAFAIAVDEVQTGFFRTGAFLSYQPRLPDVDIVAMAKAMSANVFPVGAALVREAIYQQALATNPVAVEAYAQLARCQFGAHVGLHAIEIGEQENLAQHAAEMGAYFRQRLEQTLADVPTVKEVRGVGLMIGIEFEPSKIPAIVRQSFGGLIAARCVNDRQHPVLSAFNPDKPWLIRFVPPLCITRDEIDIVVDTIRRALHSRTLGLLKPIVTNLINTKLGRGE